MAFDELIRGELSLLNTLLFGAVDRWTNAANRARTSAYTIGDAFQDMRDQFVDNWDTWNLMMGLPTDALLPTVTVHGPYTGFNGVKGLLGKARVNKRLTYAAYNATDLVRLDGGATIKSGMVTVDDAGDFEGVVRVKICTAAAPLVAPAAGPDVYRGVVLARFSTGAPWGSATEGFEPLAWLVAVVN
jgi:hypothetical protein